MKNVLFLISGLLVCASAAAQMPSNNELKDIFSRNVVLANAGDSNAQMALCSSYAYGLGTAQDPGQALSFCSQAAKAGVPRAQLLLGDFYLQGKGTKVDTAAATYWYKQALEAGMTEAHTGLASIYFDLENAWETRNLESAVMHAREAAAAGSHMGEMYLGVMYFNGFEPNANPNADIDYATSTLWFEKSAQRGNLISAAYLVNIYASDTEHQNHYKAYFWASVLQRHLPDVYPQGIYAEYETLLSSAQRDAAAEELMLMEGRWNNQQIPVSTASI